ncbi:hypothetical protein [Hymenobacter lapidarius]|uniref:hypothetical protein n=1 Tax=Hymenobacter lapidarius TaxID=1908237 RepID=UPI000B1090E4|nr:hypothetical protein [Hymenobacter lapidarius]
MMLLLEENVSLRSYNTFGLDVQARYFARFASADELRQLLQLPQVQAAEKLILGGGSNLLFTQDFDGVVLKNEIFGLQILSEDASDNTALLRAAPAKAGTASWNTPSTRA